MTEQVPAPEQHGRAAFVISQLYYYAAAVIGVGMVLGGLVGLLNGARIAILPDEYQTARDGVRQMLQAVAVMIPGGVTLWWHLRQARRRERHPTEAMFWGGALYYHAVALVSLVFILVGTSIMLSSAVDAVLPPCRVGGFAEYGPPPGDPDAPVGESETRPSEERICEQIPGNETLRRVLDGGLLLVAAVPFFWWHLRQGRRLTTTAAG